MEGGNGQAAGDRPMKTSEADPESDSGTKPTLEPIVLSSRSPCSESSPRNGVDPCGDQPGEAWPVSGPQNGEMTITENGGNCFGAQPCSAEETVLSETAESELSPTDGMEKNSPPCADSSGKGNETGTPRGDTCILSPYADIKEPSRSNSAVERGDALFCSTGSGAVHSSTSAQVSGAAPNGLGVVEYGGESQTLASGDMMERPGASAVWIAGQDPSKYVGGDEGCPSPKAALAKTEVAEKRKSVLAEEHSMPASPNQPQRPSLSPESRRVDSDEAGGARLDAARASEEAGVAQTERSGNGTVAVARTPPHDKSSCRAIAPGSDYGGVACQSLPRDSVWGSTEHLAPMSGHGRGRVEDGHPEPTPWGEPIEHELLGDTTDIALAAVSYANAVAEGGAIGSLTSSAAAGLESGGSRETTPAAPNPMCGKSSILTAVESNATRPLGEPEGHGIVSTDATVAFATTQPASRASLDGTVVPPKAAELSKETVPPSGTSRTSSSNGLRMTTRGEKGSHGSDHHDDMMHAMCMICLEKLSEAPERGRAKLLGLLDSCPHRYCYTCILEWSKITNKCPQCKERFHTIKAVKELTRTNDKYRGVAVRVEDRDQRYSFVDVRDVVVLDPDVTCHPGCLVRRGVDALQQGWEFSVQCEQCSNWYHGLCVGFRQEREVPDLWFCRSCCGEVYEVNASPDATPQPTESARSVMSLVSNGSSQGQDGGQSSDGEGRLVVPSVSGQGSAREEEKSQGQVPEQDSGNVDAHDAGRTVENGHQGSGSRSEAEAVVAELPQPPHTLASPAPPAPAPIQPLPPSTQPDAENSGRGTGTSYGSPQWTNLPPLERMWSLFGAQHSVPGTLPPRPPVPVRASSAPPSSPPVVASSARGRGRPRGSRNKPHGQPPASPQETPGSPVLPIPPARAQSAPSPPPTRGDVAPAKVRGRPRGSKKKPPVGPSAPPALRSSPEGLLESASSAETSVLSPPGDGQQHPEYSAQPSTATSLAVDEPSRQDDIPQPPEPPAPSFLRSLEASEVTDLCTICGFDTEPENLIVYCSSCNMGVHQTCYGISEIPTKEWYCSPCSAGVHPSTLACRFCPVKGGALKRCTDGSWGHILCAFWIPECCFLDPQKMEPIGSINRKGQASGVEKFLPAFRARKCYVCGTSAGSAIRCHASSCKFHLHPMCGSMAGSVYMEIETTMKRGFDGTEHESVNLVARCRRHNKKAKGRAAGSAAHPKDPGSVYRGSIIGSTADPLSIIDKALEIKDPELGGVVLAGKVTWYNPERSKYCIMASGHGGSGSSGGTSSGGGEPKEGCSHWITVDKLVEAKAIGVQKNGKRFVLKRPPSLEGEETESGQRDNVKIEQRVEEDEGRREADVLPAVDEGQHNEETRKRGWGASVGLEERGSHEKDAEATAAGRRRRTDTLPSPASPPDVASAKHTAIRPEEQSRQAREPLELGSKPTHPAPGEAVEAARLPSPRGGGSRSSTEYKVASESESEEPSAATRSPTAQKKARLSPSAQFQEHTDAFTRYPIRGRRRRPENLTFDPDEQRGLEGAPSKRPRLEGEADQSLGVAADAGPDTSGVEVACPREASVAGDPVHSAPSRVCRAPRAQPSNATGVRHESRSVFDLRRGWPHGMGLLGQVPVMRVRTVRVPGGGDATYFASAYASVAEGVVCNQPSAPSFSFPFEELEEMALTSGTEQLQRDAHADSLSDHSDHFCNLSEGLQEREGKEITTDNAEPRKAREAEASSTPLSSELEQEENVDGKGKEQGEEVIEDQTDNVSSYSEGVEDGEVDTLSNGRADIMPPSPRSEDDSVGGGVEILSPTGEQAAKEGAGNSEQTAQPACRNSSMTGEAESAAKAKEMEMEISSDDVSCGGFEGAEAASPCISEDEDDDDDIGLGWGVFRVGDNPPKLSCVEPQSKGPMLGATREPAVPSPSATELTQTLRGPLSVESDEDLEKSESCLDVVVSDEAESEGRESTGDEQTLRATSGAGGPRPERELPAPEREPEIATVQPPAPQQTRETLALRSIVRQQLHGVLKSASKGEEAALAGGDGNGVLERIAYDTEHELFRRLFKDITGGREYKAKYKQLLLSLGNVRNYRLVASVLAGNTTPVDLATKDAVGLLNSLSSSLNCLAIPLAGRHRPGSPAGSPAGKGHKGKGKRRGKMILL